MKKITLLFVLSALPAFQCAAELRPAGTSASASSPATKSVAGTKPKPVYSSHIVTSETVGHTVEIDVEIKGAEKLWLVVTDGGNGFGMDWANWVEPRLVGDYGTRKLTEMRWNKASSDWGEVRKNLNAGGGHLIVNDKSVAEGIGTHANSVIEFELPAGTQRFQAKGALDKGGVSQNGGTSVVFQVWTTEPKVASSSGGGGGPKEPDAALSALDVAAGLDASLFASEPMLLSPSSIDIDSRGRVWVAEIVNYRSHNGKRKEGDRILILEDVDGDGKADKQTVFYQGTDLISPHGVCVLDGEVIVSAGDKVMKLIDTDRDDKADKTEVLFTGLHGAQHDHGIHAFHFGPDGKLYFNFGNSGQEIKDKDGKPVVDLAGNVVAAHRKPYQQGLVFRCNPDLTEFETLGWNFRNNWEVNVDSYGTLWQSDNDDDGNKSVRINYVMEFGNYGYCDELTGASWQKGDAKTEAEVQAAHWHLSDPGVVPNLLHTGAGSPTGILVYEGSLLPDVFHNQMIHCDAGPNIVRAYPVKTSGAGYSARVEDILLGARDKWFRPSDVCVAPDGSLFVADWYDPGVGGHAMGDLDRGRIYRVAPPKALESYKIEKPDFNTVTGVVKALANPNENTRYLAWSALQKLGAQAEGELQAMVKNGKPHEKARAIWAQGKLTPAGPATVQAALKNADPNLRIVGIRLARQLKLDILPIAEAAADDASPMVRREVSLALRHLKTPEAAKVWAKLAAAHDGKDAWYLAALNIGAQLNWDACLEAWLALVGDKWDTPAGRDIIWVSRGGKTNDLIVGIITKSKIPAAEKLRFIRSLDFLPDDAARQAAIKQLLGSL